MSQKHFEDFFEKHGSKKRHFENKNIEQFSEFKKEITVSYENNDHLEKKNSKRIQLNINIKRKTLNIWKEADHLKNKYFKIKEKLKIEKIKKIKNRSKNLNDTIINVFRQNELIFEKIVKSQKEEIVEKLRENDENGLNLFKNENSLIKNNEEEDYKKIYEKLVIERNTITKYIDVK